MTYMERILRYTYDEIYDRKTCLHILGCIPTRDSFYMSLGGEDSAYFMEMGGTIDGRRGHHVLLAPPFIISDAELELIVERISSTLNAILPALDQAA